MSAMRAAMRGVSMRVAMVIAGGAIRECNPWRGAPKRHERRKGARAGLPRRGLVDERQPEQLGLAKELARQAILQLVEPLGMQGEFVFPGRGVHARQRLEFFAAYLQPRPVDVFEARHPAQRRFLGAGAALDAVDDPPQYAHVLAEARPHEVAALVHAEPVHAEYARWMLDHVAHAQPVVEVVAHVVAAEGQHGERIAPYHTLLSRRRGCRLRAQRGR